MIKKFFIDADIILDVALARYPFFSSSKFILAMAENNIIIGAISSNCVTISIIYRERSEEIVKRGNLYQ